MPDNFMGAVVYPIIIAVVILIPTTIFAYWQVKKNDFENKKREIVLNYQIEVYRKLALAVQRDPIKGSQYFRDLESAVADIQLFGTKTQNETLQKFLDQWQKESMGDLDSILSDIRDELRKELGFEEIKERVKWFRPEGAPDIDAIKMKKIKGINSSV